MATLVFTAVGTALGGPLGGAIGGLVGQQIDAAIFGAPGRQGPRLNDLKITTSSYGSVIPRHYGAVRAPGTVIWATDLVEHSETQGGGKGSPSVTTYSYTISFAVALASRPIRDIGRIWADGNLLRGAAGDLKAGGTLRFYSGHGDHPVDPLLASAEGAACPAYRGTAYAVFEDLDLSGFGNRIPALTFEIIADDNELSLARLLEDVTDTSAIVRPLPLLDGFSAEGGALSHMLATIHEVYPLACDSGGETLSILPADLLPDDAPQLPEAAVAGEESDFGARDGLNRRRETSRRDLPAALRYYDQDRDYLAGVQRADGKARPGRATTIEFPGTLSASAARRLANEAAERANWSREIMAWRLAELDPQLRPGSIVRAPGKTGLWRIESWEWREHGVELELHRLPRRSARAPLADPGSARLPSDLAIGATILAAFELPWDGHGTGDSARLYALASSAAAGWAGAALYVNREGAMIPLGSSGPRRGIIGHCIDPVPPSPALLLDRQGMIELQLVAADLTLSGATPSALAMGANRALLGSEIIQFASATPFGDGRWRLEGLLRGRGGSEAAAMAGHAPGTGFAMLDDRLTALDPLTVGSGAATEILALGLADSEPVTAHIINAGITRRPLSPVHPRAHFATDGALSLGWTRRARGAWAWLDSVETPLGEEAEAWLVGLGPVSQPLLNWNVSEPLLHLDATTVASIATAHPGQPLWVRQTGTYALSDPLHLITLA